MPRGRTNRTPEKRAAFLLAVEETGGNVTRACKASKISKRSAYDWRAEDEAFKAEWDAAVELGLDSLEDEARRRAHDGVTKPIYHQGKKVGTVQEYSDTLLIFLLKGGRPEKYRERVDAHLSGKVTLEQLVQSAATSHEPRS